jgi:hypothetical protein
MKKDKIVQFVFFETTLDSEAFILQWEQYKRSVKSNINVTLQQQVLKNGTFKYISQHPCPSGEFQFIFMKERRSSKSPEVEIKRKQAGGYSVLQHEANNDLKAHESKIFVFILKPETDLDLFRQFSVHGKLNIYEAYYENCDFAYILEFFVKNEYAGDVLQQLKILTSFEEAGIYKECLVHA